MKATIYTSDWCSEGYILEEEKSTYVKLLWCDECEEKHNFLLLRSFSSLEELWEYMASEEKEFGLITME